LDVDRFQHMVSRLEAESAAAPRRYRAKVAALVVLGFAILAVMLATAGLGLLLLAGVVVAAALSGGAALVLVLKLGKLVALLAIPVWYLVRASVKALFIRLPAPEGRAITRTDAPALFAAIDRMRAAMHGPRIHQVLVVDGVNAALVQRPAFGLVGWPRNHLLLGLPLLECMAPEEALAVVAHEYGHLAGSHGHFAAFVYRLRHTWGTVQACTDHIRGWLGALVAPMVRWYAPYFNAYTFVLARADEYEADAASARLVGAIHASRALKRVNVVDSQHRGFMQRTYDRIDHEPSPPQDLLQRWAAHAVQPPDAVDARRWLGDALDRTGHYADTHPTLRARLAALREVGEPPEDPPPAVAVSAATAWLGTRLPSLRAEFASSWAAQVAGPWTERHAEAQKLRARLQELRELGERSSDQELELLRLALRLEPETDLRDAFAAFNAAHADRALGLFLEGIVRLDRGERDGLALLERAAALDPEATKPVCERAIAFLGAQGDKAAADAWAERWRRRDALETARAHELEHLQPRDRLVAHALDAATLQAIRAKLNLGGTLACIRAAWLARRPIAADPAAVQHVVGIRLTWWGRLRGKQREVLTCLAALEWPVPLVFVALDGRLGAMRKGFEAVGGNLRE